MSSNRSVLVSVITATHNYGRYIADTLACVRAQTFQEWECLIVDDASTDGTSEVVAPFVAADARFRYIRLDGNVGVAAARNQALRASKGTFIQFLDADDLIDPDKLEGQVRALQASPDTTVVYSDFSHFRERPGDAPADGYRPDEKITGSGRVLMARLIKGNIFRPATTLFRSAILERSGLFDARFRYVEDLDLWFRMAAAGATFQFLDDPKCRAWVRVHGASLSHDRHRMRNNYLPVMQRMWAQNGLSFRSRCSVLLRYVDAFLEGVIVRRGRIVLLPEDRFPFLTIVIVLAILLLPIWLITRPFRRST
ncbi:MAG: glycosyltransferase family 2 protein [Flavobacteriales bacterium]|nr:glycosyltransferase family 2 protein [Flavobacteriales bacterium]